MSRPGPPAPPGPSPGPAEGPGEATDPAPRAWPVPLVAAAVLVAVYLGPWLSAPDRPPVGFDTAGYVWRANAVWESGLESLPTFRERPGHPVLVGVLRDVTRASPIDLARTWPATIAVAIGAATAALAWAAGGRETIVAMAAAIGVGASAFVATTAIGYAGNLLVDAFVVAGVAVALRMREIRDGTVLLTVLVTAAAVTHWMFGLVLVALVAVVVLTFALERHDATASGPAARRLVLALGIAVLLAVGAMLLAPALPREVVHQTFRENVERRVERRMPPFRLDATLPLAAAGGLTLGFLGDRRRRRSLPVLLAWAAIAPAGLLAWYGLELKFPPYRTAAVALGIPLLVVLGAGAVAGRWIVRRRWALAGAAAALTICVAMWLAWVGATTWWRTEPLVTADELRQAATLDAYLGTLPTGTVAVVPAGIERDPPLLAVKLGMRAEAVAAVDLRPAQLSTGAERFVREAVAEDPESTVVVLLRAYHRHEPDSGRELAPGVILLHGPSPDEPLAVPSSATEAGELVRVTAVALLVLSVVGAGWSLAAGRPAVQAVALAPAVGAAVLVVAGLVAGRLGLPLAGGGGIAIAVAAGAAGWIARTVPLLRAR